ncbi:undecaprenyl/decaprenyl-phosphate alpha-N-acetylglucosaminyl 1-phosphate transferase [Pedobacter changchengzhani]|uniref:Undecaprenyl/decaprenyl-phosphate alpha-N-acetylglucosaminyl 1-phosphate transferase n=2 Tax=Pedobacter changchengzhani TaxID=2529274 RepID=A0A4R5MLT3_9SPHI|nr:undecaprenyl/decaprenyl-phosphate alpha-N-acetylglucosaminyl 1-phosphate transferase [Pedobacter changchengzhani]
MIAFSIVIFSIPSVIYSALKYKLFDSSDLDRKTHGKNISRLGGIPIFVSFTISVLLFSTLSDFKEANFLIIACIILSALGLKDDMYGTNITTKFILQLTVAIILVFFGDFRLSSFYGVLNIGELNYIGGSLFSIILIIFLNNAFNLIDGVDGLAASIGILSSLCFGFLFASMHEATYACIAFALVGALVGFIKYNWWPAKIFMGDTGALTIGLICATLAIKFIELNKLVPTGNPDFQSSPAIAVAILIVPIFDSIRVFCVRILNKKSPFRGDRNHIHHRLERLGLSSRKLVLLTVFLNISIIAFTVLFRSLGNFNLIVIIMSICIIFNMYLSWRLRVKENQTCDKKISDRNSLNYHAKKVNFGFKLIENEARN